MKGQEAFGDVRRLIVVAAHPDDLETICGGTIAMLTQRGVKVFSVAAKDVPANVRPIIWRLFSGVTSGHQPQP